MKYMTLAARIALFTVIIYAVNKTPLDVYTMAGRLHWNYFEMFLYSLLGFYLSWRITTVVSHWFPKQFLRWRYNRLGLPDKERISEWTAADFDKEFEYAAMLRQSAPDSQKSQMDEYILNLVEVAGRQGFVRKKDGETYRFFRMGKSDEEDQNQLAGSGTTMESTEREQALVAASRKRRWWYFVIGAVISLWLPRWIQIPVLAFVGGALRGMGDLLLTKRDRSDNALAWLFFKGALWYELFVWLYPLSNGFIAKWHLHSSLELVVSALGVTIIWLLIQVLFGWVLVAILAVLGLSLAIFSKDEDRQSVNP